MFFRICFHYYTTVTGFVVQNCSVLSAVSLLPNTLTNVVKCFMITQFLVFRKHKTYSEISCNYNIACAVDDVKTTKVIMKAQGASSGICLKSGYALK